MKYPHLHWPHLRHGHAVASPHHDHHHHHPMWWKMEKAEGVVDYFVVAGIVLLGAAMVYGLLTASGEAPWF
jgi:hypothetical protein